MFGVGAAEQETVQKTAASSTEIVLSYHERD
jgi:hypothetical protein